VGLVTLLGVGCWNYVARPVTPATVARQPIPHTRVTLRDGTSTFVDELTSKGDTLWGLVPNSAPPGHPLVRFAADASDVSAVYVKQYDFLRIGAAIVTPVAIAGTSWFLLGE
jgi:hypothetical protein